MHAQQSRAPAPGCASARERRVGMSAPARGHAQCTSAGDAKVSKGCSSACDGGPPKARQGSLVWGALQPARTARVRRVMRRAAACRSHAARRTRPRSTSCSSTSATSWRSGASPRPDAPRSRGAQRLRMRRRAQTWGPWRPPRQSRHPVLMASRACVLRLLAGPADGAGVGKHHALRDLCECAGSTSSGHADHCNRLAIVRSGRAARPSPTLLCCAALTCRLQLKQLLALRTILQKNPLCLVTATSGCK